jgi:hypothetical protein
VFTRKDSLFRVNDRRVHPDDMLKRLARNNGRVRTGPTLYVHKKRPFDKFRALFLLILGLALVIGGVAALPFLLPHNEIVVTGMERVTSVTPASLVTKEMFFSVKPASALGSLKVRIDGRVGHVRPEGQKLRWIPESDQLGEGKHTVTLESGGRFLWRGPSTRKLTVVVDSVAPTLDIAPSAGPAPIYSPFVVRGSVEDGAAVKVNDETVKVLKGEFTKTFATPPIGMVRVEATDAAGNVTTSTIRSNVALPVLRGVHMSAISWLTPELKDPVMALAAAGKINTIQLDIKDESGAVGYRSSLPKVADLGANEGCNRNQCYDLAQAVNELHGRSLRVVGRIVVFRDPLITRAAINAGRLGDVVQRPDGSPYESNAYGGFANPASEAVQDYILDLTKEAADAGVDDILFDYIRRPEGPLSNMKFAGLPTSSADEIDGAIVSFLRKTGARLAGTKARLGVSVFGIAAKSPDDIAQNVREMSKHVDYVAPMVYPSHWSSGQYNVSDPSGQPFEIVSASLHEFQNQVAGTDAAVVPWLQDFTLGSKKYGAVEVRKQIMASRSENAEGFLLWDPKVTYSAAGIPDDAPPVAFTAATARAGAVTDRPLAAPTVPPATAAPAK